MTDLDTLRRALRAQQDPGPDGRATPDLGDIMARGRRLRFRRRLAAAGGAVCAAAIVFGVVSGISQLTRPSPVPAQHPAGSTRTEPPPSPRHTYVSTPVPVPSQGAGTFNPVPLPSQGAGVSLAPTPSKAAGSVPVTPTSNGTGSVPATPSKAAGSVPVTPTSNGTGSTPVPLPSQGQLAMVFWRIVLFGLRGGRGGKHRRLHRHEARERGCARDIYPLCRSRQGGSADCNETA